MAFWENDYHLLQQLSREKSKRFGTTYLLEHKTNGTKVVLKTVETKQEIGFQQLQNEAKFSFDEKGLPQILDAKLEDGMYSILKTYHPGITLESYWKTIKKRHKISAIKSLTKSLLIEFSVLNDKSIIHGDIKPENIIVQQENEEISCHLIDFGLAFYTNDLPERKTLFQLAYAPPEIILNQLDCADHSSDIFSFCLVIYKLWTGKLPFTASNPAFLTQLQITYPIEKPWRMQKNLWGILEKGLQKHPFKTSPNRMKNADLKAALKRNNENRFQDFNSFAQAILAL